jgi:outer membrane protein
MRTLALFFVALMFTSSYAENIKIGYIDVDLVINSLTKYKENNESLILNFQPKKVQLLEIFDQIQALKENLKKSEKSMSDENYDKEIDKIRTLEIDFQNETELWQSELNKQQAESLEKIEILINQAIKDLAINEKYDLILYQNAAFVSEDLNISNKIILNIENLK